VEFKLFKYPFTDQNLGIVYEDLIFAILLDILA